MKGAQSPCERDGDTDDGVILELYARKISLQTQNPENAKEINIFRKKEKQA